jgi:hypothetical protein
VFDDDTIVVSHVASVGTSETVSRVVESDCDGEYMESDGRDCVLFLALPKV